VSGLGALGQTGGGKIVLGGGLDDGANGGTAGDGIPDGFAWGQSDNSDWSSGVRLSRERGADSIRLLSGGGDIIIRGRASNANNTGLGVMVFDGVGINSGTGRVDITGVGSTTWHGIEFAPWDWANRISITSGSTSPTAISIVGSTRANNGSSGVYIAYRGAQGTTTGYSLSATGAGGGIYISGTSAAGASTIGLRLESMDILAASGPITLESGTTPFILERSILGAKAGSSVTVSSSNITNLK
jgi:hypothetical protein